MKFALINDTHFGVRNDSPFFLENALSFFENQFFPYLKENNITDVIHLGDFFDRRKYINFNTLSAVQKRFLDKFQDNNLKLHITIGNHDTYFRNTNQLNSIKEIIDGKYDCVHIYENPTVIQFDDFCFGIVPWITKENEAEVINFLKTCNCRMIGGHFEIMGFEVINGVKHPHGLKSDTFKRFEYVLSGHFHIKQSQDNIYYLGTQYQMSFSDLYSTKGFHVYDIVENKLQFIENNNNIFHLFVYDDSSELGVQEIGNFIKNTNLKNGFVRINVRCKNKQKIFDKFIDALWEKQIQDLSINEEVFEKSSIEFSDASEDTMSIINREIDAIERDIDKVKLKTIIKDLYMESLSV